MTTTLIIGLLIPLLAPCSMWLSKNSSQKPLRASTLTSAPSALPSVSS